MQADHGGTIPATELPGSGLEHWTPLNSKKTSKAGICRWKGLENHGKSTMEPTFWVHWRGILLGIYLLWLRQEALMILWNSWWHSRSHHPDHRFNGNVLCQKGNFTWLWGKQNMVDVFFFHISTTLYIYIYIYIYTHINLYTYLLIQILVLFRFICCSSVKSHEKS